MVNKVEIIERCCGTKVLGYDVPILMAMDEYAEQEAIRFIKWVNENKLDFSIGEALDDEGAKELYTQSKQ